MNLKIKILVISILTFWLNYTFSQNVFSIDMGYINMKHFVITKDSSFAGYLPNYNLNAPGGYIYEIDKYGFIKDSLFNIDFHIIKPHSIFNSKGGYLLFGETRRNLINDGIGTDLVVQSVNYKGEITWELPLEGQQPYDAIKTTDDNLLILADILEHPDYGYTDVVLYKINEEGEIIWKNVVGVKKMSNLDEDILWEHPNFVTEIDGNYYLSYNERYFDIGKKSNDVLVKFNEHGEKQWTLNDKDYSLKLNGIISLFKLNNEIYFANSNEHNIIKLNDFNGSYTFTDKNIGVLNFGIDSRNFVMNCNELVLIENINDHYFFNKYNNIEAPYYSKPINSSVYITDIKKTLDGGFAFFNKNGWFTKTDCFGNIDFWDEECTKRLKANQEVIIYPNPTSGLLNIETNFDIRKIVVIDNIGKEVIFNNFCNCGKQTIDVSAYAQGTYFLKIIGKDSFQVKRFVLY